MSKIEELLMWCRYIVVVENPGINASSFVVLYVL